MFSMEEMIDRNRQERFFKNSFLPRFVTNSPSSVGATALRRRQSQATFSGDAASRLIPRAALERFPANTSEMNAA